MKPPLPPRRNAETLKRETLGHQSFHLKGRNTKPCRECGINSRQKTVTTIKKWYP